MHVLLLPFLLQVVHLVKELPHVLHYFTGPFLALWVYTLCST